MSQKRDAEVAAMEKIGRVLEPLDNGTRRRLLYWARERYVREEITLVGDDNPSLKTRAADVRGALALVSLSAQKAREAMADADGILQSVDADIEALNRAGEQHAKETP